jgi:hypothetical protein
VALKLADADTGTRGRLGDKPISDEAKAAGVERIRKLLGVEQPQPTAIEQFHDQRVESIVNALSHQPTTNQSQEISA